MREGSSVLGSTLAAGAAVGDAILEFVALAFLRSSDALGVLRYLLIRWNAGMNVKSCIAVCNFRFTCLRTLLVLD